MKIYGSLGDLLYLYALGSSPVNRLMKGETMTEVVLISSDLDKKNHRDFCFQKAWQSI